MFVFSGEEADCHAACQQVEETCIELTRTGSCTWQGTGPQHACYPTSTVLVSFVTNGVNTTVTGIWHMGGSSFIRYRKLVPQATVDCQACFIYELLVNDTLLPIPGDFCDYTGSYMQVNFQPFGGCCQYCADQYQVTLSGFLDTHALCDDGTCQDLNGVYLLDYVESDVQPPACSDGVTGWCHYESDALNLDCESFGPNVYGYCKIHAYIKSLDTCQTLVAVLLEMDTAAGGFTCPASTYNGWGLPFNPISQVCNSLDFTFTSSNVCFDSESLCRLDETAEGSPACRIQAV